jgi:arginase
MAVILVPFHQDDRLPAATIQLPGDRPDLDVELVDPVLGAGDQWSRLIELYRVVAESVATRMAAEPCPTVVSGDCLIALATLTGVQRAGVSPTLVWFDAHGDVHTLSSSASGYLGGMALRMAVGGDPDKLTGPLGLQPLPESQAVLVDARDLDPAEADFLAAGQVRRIRVEDVTADQLPDVPLLVHVDLDVIDGAEVPGLLFPVPDGPDAASVIAAVHRLLDTGRVVALDLACTWHPDASAPDAAARAALLGALLKR